MADPVEGTITALPPLIGSLNNGMLFETANSGVSQSVTAEQIAAFAVGPDGVVPETRTISTPDSGGLSGGGTLASNLTLSMNPNVLNAKTVPVAADAVVINDSSGNTPAKTTLSDFYKSIAGLSHQMAPVPTTYSIVLYDSANGNTYQSTLQEAFVVSGTLPVGGTTGQALIKSSDADFETEWSNSTGSVTSVTVSAGAGLSGGGTITSSGTITLALANTAVTASSYGSSSASPTFTVDAQGRLTAAANATITPTAIGAVPTTRTITAGTGLTGGGDLSANRTLAIDVTGVSAATYGDSTHVSQVAVNTQGQITSASSVAISLASLGAVPTSRTLTAGTGLTGGGTLAADRTFTLADTAVTPGSYGTASTVGTFTVDQQGRITAATPTTITPAAIGAVPTTRAVNTATGLTGGGALSSDLTINYNITALANKASPSSVSDLVLIWDAAASAYKNATVGSIASGGSVSSFNTRTGAVVSASGDYSVTQLAMTTGNRLFGTDGSGNPGNITMGTGVTLSSSTLNTPWTQSGNDISNNNTGVVNIGASSVGYKLNVLVAANTAASFESTSGVNELLLLSHNGGSNFGSDIQFKDGTTNSAEILSIVSGGLILRALGTAQLNIGVLSTLDVLGSFGTAASTITSNTTLTASQHTLLGNAVSGAFTFTLPAASGCAGREYVIKKIDTTANAVTINVSGGGNIDGTTSFQLTIQYQVVKVQSDGTQWWII